MSQSRRLNRDIYDFGMSDSESDGFPKPPNDEETSEDYSESEEDGIDQETDDEKMLTASKLIDALAEASKNHTSFNDLNESDLKDDTLLVQSFKEVRSICYEV